MEILRNINISSRKRLATLGIAVSCFAAACGPAGQIGSTNIVDCQNGPKTNSKSLLLPEGYKLDLNNNDNGLVTHPGLELTSKGDGKYVVSQSRVEAVFIPDKGIVFDGTDGNYYSINISSGSQHTTQFEISVACPSV